MAKEERSRRKKAHPAPQVAPSGKGGPYEGKGSARGGVSRKPGKQRKRVHESRLHEKGDFLRVHLAPSYLEDPKVDYPRSLPVREGDTVKVLRGSYRGTEGKVTEVDRRRLRVLVEGVTVAQADGTEIGKPIHPSNLMITKLDMTDPWRKKLVERAGGGG